MRRIARITMLSMLVGLATAPTLAQNAAPGGLPGDNAPAAVADGDVLAAGAGGPFTRDAAEAYVEALEFTLGEIGQPTAFDAGKRAQIQEALAAGFSGLPVEVQVDLANARPLWTEYHAAWPTLPLQAKQEFAYYILTLAYGEQAAAQALGLNVGDAGGGGGGGDNPSVDDLMGSVPGTTDCWGSAGCTGYDAGSGTYTFESYD